MFARAVVRILTGALFFAEGWSKIAGPFVRGGFAADLADIARGSVPFWRTFLERFIVPHAAAAGWLIALGELSVGIGLLLGLWTRVACAGGAALMLAIMMGGIRPHDPKAWTDWVTAALTPKLAFLLFVLLFTVDPGRTWGLDGVMGRKKGPRAIRA
ncbi:MAG TPA: DoxX family protein [Thermoanaerobaculia bacterium]|nr:DoxX family protein [Thermoanaerobaculia bacterium]